MARADKEFTARMQGEIFAYNLVKEQGIEALEKDIRHRGILRAPMKFSQKQMDEFITFMSENLYQTMLTVTLMALHETFQFGKVRMKRFKEKFDKLTEQAVDLDWIGEHYVTLEDYAHELNRKYDFGIDTIKIAVCKDSNDESNPRYGMANMDHLLEELQTNGFADAAEFLKGKRS